MLFKDMDDAMKIQLSSTKGRRELTGTVDEIVAAAVDFNDEMQPAAGIDLTDIAGRCHANLDTEDEIRAAVDELAEIVEIRMDASEFVRGLGESLQDWNLKAGDVVRLNSRGRVGLEGVDETDITPTSDDTRAAVARLAVR